MSPLQADLQRFLDAVPSGEPPIEWNPKIAELSGPLQPLLAFAQPKTISREGNRATIRVTSGASEQVFGDTLTINAPTLGFSVANSGAVAVMLSQITGLRAGEGILSGNLTKVEATPLPNGNLTLAITVTVSFLGDRVRTITVDPDGKIVK